MVTTHYCNDSCTADWLREMRALEAEQDHEAVTALPYPKIREYPCKDTLLGFADGEKLEPIEKKDVCDE